jgi:hypothetical protein
MTDEKKPEPLSECGEVDSVFGPGIGPVCTEPAEHEGDHVATDEATGRVVSRWLQGPKPLSEEEIRQIKVRASSSNVPWRTREDVGRLLAEIERLQEENQKAREAFEWQYQKGREDVGRERAEVDRLLEENRQLRIKIDVDEHTYNLQTEELVAERAAADRVRAEEREACAEIAEDAARGDMADPETSTICTEVAAKIRARGEKA